MHDKFVEQSSISNYNTRNSTDLQIPRFNLECNRKKFSYTRLKAWNGIPAYNRGIDTLTRFKNELRKHFLS